MATSIDAANLTSAVGSLLQAVTPLIGGGAQAPAQAPAAQPAPAQPQDTFQNAAGAAGQAGAAPAAGGQDQLTQALSGLVDLIKQLVQVLQGGGAAAGGDTGAAGANAAGGSAAATATAGAGAAPGAAAPATASGDSAAASAAAAAAAQQQQQSAPVPGSGTPEAEAAGLDPLMFDLNGKGAGFDTSHDVSANLLGKGNQKVNDLKAGTGLLTFAGDPSKGILANSFGDKTDLSKYGIKGDKADGSFSNGFAALRAAGEKFGLISGKDQTLDGSDLKVLEQKIGLKMRTGGLNGQDQSLAGLGISKIDLGAASGTQSLATAGHDAGGNTLQGQAGAAFTINGQDHTYIDGWIRDHGKA
ncbi:MAG TPA: hypothetical protein VND93_15840 [Myxococcales bacterium]|nr:hypothetical protein [Myxococcales bacterium]